MDTTIRMSQWYRDHTGKVDVMGITMFYVILTVINITIMCTCYTMHCFKHVLWIGSCIIWLAQKNLGILYYEIFISDVKWYGTDYI